MAMNAIVLVAYSFQVFFFKMYHSERKCIVNNHFTQVWLPPVYFMDI